LGLRAWLRTASGERVVLLGMLLALLIFYRATPQLPLTLLGAALFGGLALLRPALALLFVPGTVLLFFIPKGIWDERLSITADADGFLIPLHEVVLLTVVGATALHAALDGVRWLLHRPAKSVAGVVAVLRSFVVRHAGLLGAVALFFLVGTLGVVVAGGEGRRAALREWRWLIVEPLLFYGLLWYHTWRLRHTAGQSSAPDVPPVVGASLVATPGALRGALLTALVTGGALVGLIGVLQFLGLNLVPLLGYKVSFSDDRLFVEGVRRVSSVYGHPNNLGLTMGRIWPIAAVLALAAVLSPVQPVRWGRALFFGIGALLCIGGLLVSFSKGALLGAFGAVVVLVVLLPHGVRGALAGSRRRRVVLAGVGGVLVLVVVAAILFAGERLNPLGETSSIRLKTWASALAMASDHPLFGVGLDQFGQHYQAYMHPSLAATNERFTSHPHNLLLDIWLRMGVVGVAVFAWLVVRFYRRVLPVRAEHQQAGFLAAPGDYVRLGGLAAMTAALLHGMVDNFYFVPDLAYIFWLLLWVGEG
jgi:O-antigen ligase